MTPWFFMFINTLLVPLAMILFGALFKQKAPSNINMLFGYRTKKSMQNPETWRFAHNYMGKLWYKYGFIMLLLTIVANLFTVNQNDNIMVTVGMVITFVQIILMMVPIYFVEKALKANFDEEGNPKQKK